MKCPYCEATMWFRYRTVIAFWTGKQESAQGWWSCVQCGYEEAMKEAQ